MRRRRASRLFVVALALLGGCAHRTAAVAPTAATPASPLAAVTPPQLESIGRILNAVAVVRGLPVTSRPRIELLDDDQFRTICVPDHVRLGQSPQAAQKDCSDGRFYYDADSDRLVLQASRLTKMDAFDRTEVLAHELEHWLVFHALPKLRWSEPSDELLAQHALLEGDAVITSTAYLLSRSGQGLASYIQRVLADCSRDEAKSIDDSHYFIYWLGTRFVGELFARGGFRAVDEAFRRPPRSTAEILHVDRYLAHEPPRTIGTTLPLPPGFTVDSRGSMGEFGLRHLLALCVRPAMAITIAEDYVADDTTGSKPAADARQLFRSVILWRSEAAAMSFARTMNRCTGADAHTAQEDALSVVVEGLDESTARTYAAAVLADVRRAAPQAPPPGP